METSPWNIDFNEQVKPDITRSNMESLLQQIPEDERPSLPSAVTSIRNIELKVSQVYLMYRWIQWYINFSSWWIDEEPRKMYDESWKNVIKELDDDVWWDALDEIDTSVTMIKRQIEVSSNRRFAIKNINIWYNSESTVLFDALWWEEWENNNEVQMMIVDIMKSYWLEWFNSRNPDWISNNSIAALRKIWTHLWRWYGIESSLWILHTSNKRYVEIKKFFYWVKAALNSANWEFDKQKSVWERCWINCKPEKSDIRYDKGKRLWNNLNDVSKHRNDIHRKK